MCSGLVLTCIFTCEKDFTLCFVARSTPWEIKAICSEIWPKFDYQTCTRDVKYIIDVLLPEVGI